MTSSLFRGVELNHVTLRTKNLQHSKNFYERLIGLRVAKEENGVCYLDSGKGFLSIWQSDQAVGSGFDHLCFGVENFDRSSAFSVLRSNHMSLRSDASDPNTIYVLDPDGIAVQIEPAGFKT